MSDNLKFLFQYLKKIDITIDQDEFAFQVQSHPDFPSLLSIVDTLSFFNINNVAIHVPISNLDLLPNHFVSLLKEEIKEPRLYYIEKRGTNYYCYNENKMELISRFSLESRWNDIVLFVEKSEIDMVKSKKIIQYILPLISFILFLIVISRFKIGLTFFILPTLGLIFSIVALKDLFGVRSEFVNNFCNFAVSTSCSDVVDSDKWKIFKLINFSDLSIFLFTSQFSGLLFFVLSGNAEDFFSIQMIILFFSLPVIFLSLYYQKFVEKKWCPICLVIISIVLFELGYLLLTRNLNMDISFYSMILFGLVFSSCSLIWFFLKKLLTVQKKLREFQLNAKRFIRNYEIFKNTLLRERKVDFPEIPITLGNREAKTVITLISSPFCKHCKNTHEILDEILKKYSNSLQVHIILKSDLKHGSNENVKLFRSLYKIYSFGEIKMFAKALKEWYDNTNLKNWLTKYNFDVTDNFDETMNLHNDWCKKNEISYTPAIFINGYEYPKLYERDNLEYYVAELIEDSF